MQASKLKLHRQFVHDIDVQWLPCDQDRCSFMTKSAVNLKLHKQDVHGIGFRWHHCDQVGCDHKAKVRVCEDEAKTARSEATS